jgi:hypothetical protein
MRTGSVALQIAPVTIQNYCCPGVVEFPLRYDQPSFDS